MPLLRGGRGSPGRVALLYGVLTALALAGPLTACSDATPTPGPLPSTSAGDPTHATPSDDPTPSTPDAAPTMPDAAHGTSAKAAKAFARYFLEVFNHAMLSGDTDRFDDLSRRGCTTCKALSRQIRRANSNGGYVEGGKWSIASFAYVATSKTGALATATIHIARQRVYPTPGASPSTAPPTDGVLDFRLTRRANSWQVRQLVAS